VANPAQELDPNDLDMFNKFLPTRDDPILRPGEADEPDGEGINLTDLILEKIAAHEAAQAGQQVIHGGGVPEDAVELPAKVVDVYSKYAILPLYANNAETPAESA
jgi:essential nuclear protein 1